MVRTHELKEGNQILLTFIIQVLLENDCRYCTPYGINTFVLMHFHGFLINISTKTKYVVLKYSKDNPQYKT